MMDLLFGPGFLVLVAIFVVVSIAIGIHNARNG